MISETNQARIDPGTRLGSVHLRVNDGAMLSEYYQALGLSLLERDGSSYFLGAGERAILVLEERNNLRRYSHTAGLFHFAILLPKRVNLALALRHYRQNGIRVGGFADHGVSEALYLTDPEGNGIEIYRDRRREEWTYHHGSLEMVTEPLDLTDLLAEADGQEGPAEFPVGTSLGHIHLHVGNINGAEEFYGDILGFERITRYGPQATFLAAGGYHHHIGANIWAGADVPPLPDDGLGLERFTIVLPDESERLAVCVRLATAGWPYAERNGLIDTRDPSGNRIGLEVAPSA